MSLIPFGQQAPREPIEPVAPETPAPARTRGRARIDLVARAIKLLRDDVTEPMTMAELSRQLGISERTLRAAFHDVLGLSPKQYALGQRLRAAREALCAADPRTTTVTDIATAYGFFELGRFAGRYRTLFGEAPSETLHQALEHWSEEAA